MTLMIESVIHNSMIIRANATIPKSVVARIGITVSAVRIARRDPPVHRARWAPGDGQVLKVFLASEARWVRKARKALLVPSAPRVPQAKPVLLVLKGPRV